MSDDWTRKAIEYHQRCLEEPDQWKQKHKSHHWYNYYSLAAAEERAARFILKQPPNTISLDDLMEATWFDPDAANYPKSETIIRDFLRWNVDAARQKLSRSQTKLFEAGKILRNPKDALALAKFYFPASSVRLYVDPPKRPDRQYMGRVSSQRFQGRCTGWTEQKQLAQQAQDVTRSLIKVLRKKNKLPDAYMLGPDYTPRRPVKHLIKVPRHEDNCVIQITCIRDTPSDLDAESASDLTPDKAHKTPI